MYIMLSCYRVSGPTFVIKNWGCTLELNNIEPIIIQLFKGLTWTEIKRLNSQHQTWTPPVC